MRVERVKAREIREGDRLWVIDDFHEVERVEGTAVIAIEGDWQGHALYGPETFVLRVIEPLQETGEREACGCGHFLDEHGPRGCGECGCPLRPAEVVELLQETGRRPPPSPYGMVGPESCDCDPNAPGYTNRAGVASCSWCDKPLTTRTPSRLQDGGERERLTRETLYELVCLYELKQANPTVYELLVEEQRAAWFKAKALVALSPDDRPGGADA